MNITKLIDDVSAYLCDAQRRIHRTDLQSLRNVSDEAISRLGELGRFKLNHLKVRARIMAAFAGKCCSEKEWRNLTERLAKLTDQPQRDPAAVRAELIDSVADDLNSAQVQSVVEGGANRRRLESVAGVASQSIGGDSFVPILRRLEGPLLTDEQWKEFLFRIPYR